MVSGLEFYEGGWVGKLRQDDLVSVVLDRVRSYGYSSTRVGPSVGEDAAIVDLGSCALVMHSDPITESRFNVGKLAIDVASNDIAVRGARPQWALVTLLMPAGSRLSSLSVIVEDLVLEAKRLGIEIVGGHTEATPGITHPIVIATVAGCACRNCVVTTGSVRPGDLIYQVRPVAMEATAIIAADFKDLALKAGASQEDLRAALELINGLSMIRPALELAWSGLVHSMHDPTEGGLVGGAYEMAAASGVNLIVDSSKVIALDVSRRLFSALNLDILKAMSSGSILVAIPPEARARVETLLSSMGEQFSFIGYAEPAEGRPSLKVIRGSMTETYVEPPEDEIARLWVGSNHE